MANEGFLGRWSRLKRDATVPAAPGDADEAPAAAPQEPATPEREDAHGAARPAGADIVAPGTGMPAAAPAATPQAHEAPPLPSLESLGMDSDYSPFMRGDVDPATRVSALKKLFSDPHFNRMDGLDVYIDDYGKPDPIPPALLAQLNQSRLLGLFKEKEPAEAAPADGSAVAEAGSQFVGSDTRAEAGDPAASDGSVHAGDAVGSDAGERKPPVAGGGELADGDAVAGNAPSPGGAPTNDSSGRGMHGIAPPDADPEDSPPVSRRAS
jgi:hypothetical protein